MSRGVLHQPRKLRIPAVAPSNKYMCLMKITVSLSREKFDQINGLNMHAGMETVYPWRMILHCRRNCQCANRSLCARKPFNGATWNRIVRCNPRHQGEMWTHHASYSRYYHAITCYRHV